MSGHVAIRTCLICRGKRPRTALLRLALRGQVVIEDREQILPGRGAYVCPSHDCLSRLRFDRRLQRAFRGKARALTQDVDWRSLSEYPPEDDNIGG